MTANVKFIFHLKSGKTFECIEELTAEQFNKVVNIVKSSMKDGIDGMICFSDCCVRLSECAVAEWEVLNESKAEES